MESLLKPLIVAAILCFLAFKFVPEYGRIIAAVIAVLFIWIYLLPLL